MIAILYPIESDLILLLSALHPQDDVTSRWLHSIKLLRFPIYTDNMFVFLLHYFTIINPSKSESSVTASLREIGLWKEKFKIELEWRRVYQRIVSQFFCSNSDNKCSLGRCLKICKAYRRKRIKVSKAGYTSIERTKFVDLSLRIYL